MEHKPFVMPDIPLGEVIAERCFTLYERSGRARQIIIRIGKPISSELNFPGFRCPFMIYGLDLDEKVIAIPGTDAITAIQNAILVAGNKLDLSVQRLDLINALHEVRERDHPGEKLFNVPEGVDWLYRYDTQPNRDFGLWKDR